MRTITARSWDPFHGDLNNRFPRLGQEHTRVISREQWHDFRLTQPAIYNNGIFADIGGRRPIIHEESSVVHKQDRSLIRMIERSA